MGRAQRTLRFDCVSPISSGFTRGTACAFRLQRDARVGERTRWFPSAPSSSPALARIQQSQPLLSDNDHYIKVKRMVCLSDRSDLCRRIPSHFGETFLRTPPSAAAQEREPSLRVLPTGHQVLLVESLDEIGTHVLAEESLEEHIGPVDHIDHERLHLLVAETRQF
jgi:hypothetical protein